MANFSRKLKALGASGSPFIEVFPSPIISQREPTASDTGELGQIWIDEPNQAVFTLVSSPTGGAVWLGASSGTGTFTDVTVTPGDIDVTDGDVNIDTGSLSVNGDLDVVTGDVTITNGNVDISTGNVDIAGDLTVDGVLTFNGDLNLNSAALIDITSTLNAAPSIYLRANGGVNEQVFVRADQGTSATSVQITSDVGGVAIDAGTLFSIDSAATSNVTVTGAGADLNLSSVGGSVNITSTENAAASIFITSAGGVNETIVIDSQQGTSADSVTLSSNLGGISIDAGTAFSIDSVTTSNVTVTGAGADLNLGSVGGSVLISSTEDAADAIYLRANGGIAETIRIRADQGTADDSVEITSDVGGVEVNAGTRFFINGTTNSSVVVVGAAQDLTLSSVGGSVNVSSTEDASSAIYLHANGGTSETIKIHADQGTGVFSIDIASDAGGVNIAAGKGFNVDANDTSLIQVTGGSTKDLQLSSEGTVFLSSTKDAADAVYISANGGTSETITIIADQGTAIDSIELRSDVGGVRVTTGALSATTGLNLFQGATAASIQVGTGAPAHSAPKGSLYLRTDGSSTSTRAYINTDGATTWTNFTTAA